MNEEENKDNHRKIYRSIVSFFFLNCTFRISMTRDSRTRDLCTRVGLHAQLQVLARTTGLEFIKIDFPPASINEIYACTCILVSYVSNRIESITELIHFNMWCELRARCSMLNVSITLLYLIYWYSGSITIQQKLPLSLHL